MRTSNKILNMSACIDEEKAESKVELSLVCIGYNIRKYHNYKIRDKKRKAEKCKAN